MFSTRSGGNNRFRLWLEAEKEKMVRYLAQGEGVPLHRVQGRFGLIEEMLQMLEKARNLR